MVEVDLLTLLCYSVNLVAHVDMINGRACGLNAHRSLISATWHDRLVGSKLNHLTQE